MRENDDLIYKWEYHGESPVNLGYVKVQDESLRDGLQASYVVQPTLSQKVSILHLMEILGIDGADIGFPSSSPRHLEEVVQIAKYKQANNLHITLSCAGRTVEDDVNAIVEASQISGEALEADLFIGSSEIRKVVQDWNISAMCRMTYESISFAKKHGLPVMFVTEDTTRAHPDTLKEIYKVAISAGADRLCIADTVGSATPRGTEKLVQFFRQEIVGNQKIALDWHGHRDRGLDIANSLVAAANGVERIHGTALSIGERSGNASMEQLLVNLNLEGYRQDDLRQLMKYSTFASEIFQLPIPVNGPIIGNEAFSTASGVHAAAILRALSIGRDDLAGIVYSAFDPHKIGREIDIKVGPLSGRHNVEFVLRQLANIDVEHQLVEMILRAAKEGNKILSTSEIESLVHLFTTFKGDSINKEEN